MWETREGAQGNGDSLRPPAITPPPSARPSLSPRAIWLGMGAGIWDGWLSSPTKPISMSLWEYKVITSGKGGFATPAMLEKFLNDLGRDEWEIVEYHSTPDNLLAFTGLIRSTSGAP